MKRPRDTRLAVMLLTPAFAVLGVFGVGPLFYAIYMSFFRMVRGGGKTFIGASNYSEALTSEEFWNSFFVTFYYALGVVPVTIVLSFFIAAGLFRATRFRGLLRTLFFLPYVTSVVASAMIWRVLLDPSAGVANHLLRVAGLSTQNWLLEPKGALSILSGGVIDIGVGPSLALCCVIAFDIWISSGFMVVVLLAGLSAIPREIEEAARIDGASWWQSARNVTLPLLSPTLMFLAIVSLIRAFQAFSSFFALTGNGRGPLDTTQNMTVYLYANFYEYGRLGYGAAVAVLLCVALAALTIVQWRAFGRKVYYR